MQSDAAASLEADTSRLDDLNTASENTRGEVAKTVLDAASTFELLRETQSRFLENLRSEVKALTEAMSQWLGEYSERVSHQTSNRMTEWDKHTREFASHMLQTSQALSEVVDGIERQLEPSRA